MKRPDFFNTLSISALEKLKLWRWDRIIDKHEGPEYWEHTLRYMTPAFISIDDHQVLLPIDKKHHANITVLRCIASADSQILTLFLKDTTYVQNPQDEYFEAGFIAVCERLPGEAFYVTILYHEWFMVQNLNYQPNGAAIV